MIQQLEFYKDMDKDRQTMPFKNKDIPKKAVGSYIKEEDELPMTDDERQAWLKYMNERGF